MNDAHKETAPSVDAAARVCNSLLGTLVDVGSSWAAYGLKVGKMALVTSADTLGKTAQALDSIATELEKKHAAADAPAAPPPAAPPPADAPAA
jgi:2-iminoacetate synthase ThiH